MTTPTRPARQKSRTPVTIDLDQLEREDTRDPFTANIDGTVFQFVDIQDLDWQIVAGLTTDRPYLYVEAIIDPGQLDEFIKLSLPVWKMRRLTDAYREHYQIIDEGNSGASGTTLPGTRGR